MISRILKSTVLTLCFLTLSVPAFAFTQSALKNLEKHGSCWGCDLKDIQLQGWDLNGANLQNSDLSGADLTRAKLNGARLDGANLNEASFDGAELKGAVLNGANLTGATFDGAKMQKAQLIQAYFVNVSFKNADMEKADLSGGRGGMFVNFTGANVSEATWINGEKCPKGSSGNECLMMYRE
jgi:uncharacterized protein YjbI with pentapeptide repeats